MGNQDPITLALYAKEKGLLTKPGWRRFKHMVGTEKRYINTLNKAQAIKKQGPKLKFGIETPKHYNDALRLDRMNGDRLWQEAITTELDQINSYKTFTDTGKGTPPPANYKQVPVHFVFDVKFDFRRKARLVAGGHLTQQVFNDSPYNGNASLKSVRTCIFLANLNGLDLCAADVGNTYLDAETQERLYVIAGPEFGPLEGHTLIVHKALYGLRSSGTRWAKKLADSLRAMGFTNSYADPAIWMKEQEEHWEYIAAWVDDMLICSKESQKIIDTLKKEYTLKGVGFPKYYLVADMKMLEKTEKVFMMASTTYIKHCLTTYELLFGEKPKKGINCPLEHKYHPELDDSDFLDAVGLHLYRKLLGMLQWAITLGHIDIMCTVMTMSGFRCQPRNDHLDRLKRIFGFLRNYMSCSIKFRTDELDYSTYKSEKYDWTNPYGDIQKEV